MQEDASEDAAEAANHYRSDYGSAMATFHQLLNQARASISEVDAEACEKLLSEGWTLLDVRESDEWEQGSIPDSVHMPRGLLEVIVESRFPDRGTPLVAMCASGARSALAAATLAEMGYNRVVSMDGGFDRWKTEGHRWRRQRTLTPEQRKRYDRHLKLAEVGEAGQLKLLDAKILLIGVGGLGSPAALYLAAAGVGTLGIVDMDRVDESNLQRQVLHDTHSIGQLKVDSAEKALTALNPDIRIIAHSVRLDTANVLDILDGYDMIVDGTDNFPARYLLNDASVKLGIPVVHGSVLRFEGRVTVFDPRIGPTYRDVFPEPPAAGPAQAHAPSCAESGVLGVLPGIIGVMQASEAIKLILGIGSPLVGRLIVIDALDASFQEFKLRVDPSNEVTWQNRDRVEIADAAACTPDGFSSG